MANSIKRIIKILITAAFWILVWEAASLLIARQNENLALFLPGPVLVFKTLFGLIPTVEFLLTVGETLRRIFIGYIVGALIGFLLGVLTGENGVFDMLFSPALKTVRAVPVVSFIILAFLFIKEDSMPIFISSLMVAPIVWQSVNDSIKDADKNLIEMSRVYHLGKAKTLFVVKIYNGADRIVTALISAMGLAWKSGIAAEVICNPGVSIGNSISRAKSAIEYENVYALTLCIVFLSLIFEFLIKFIWEKHKKAGVNLDV